MEGYDPDLNRAVDVTTRFPPGARTVTYEVLVEANQASVSNARDFNGFPTPWTGGLVQRTISPPPEDYDTPVGLTTILAGPREARERTFSLGPEEEDRIRPLGLQHLGEPCPQSGICSQNYTYTIRLNEPWQGDEPLVIQWRLRVEIEFPPDSPIPEDATLEAWLDGSLIPPGR